LRGMGAHTEAKILGTFGGNPLVSYPHGWKGHGSLYKVRPLSDSATPLLTGQVAGELAEPILWTNLTSAGGRVVYTSLGHADDFKQPAFNRLLRNALLWAAGREIPATFDEARSGSIAFPK